MDNRGRTRGIRKPLNEKEIKALEILQNQWLSNTDLTRMLGGAEKRQCALVKFTEKFMLMEEEKKGKVFYKILTDEDIERWRREEKLRKTRRV